MARVWYTRSRKRGNSQSLLIPLAVFCCCPLVMHGAPKSGCHDYLEEHIFSACFMLTRFGSRVCIFLSGGGGGGDQRTVKVAEPLSVIDDKLAGRCGVRPRGGIQV